VYEEDEDTTNLNFWLEVTEHSPRKIKL